MSVDASTLTDELTEAELARLGMSDVTRALGELGLWPAAQAGGREAALVRRIAAEPNGAEAACGLARVAEAHPPAWRSLREAPEALARVVRVLGASDALCDLLVRRGELLEVLTGDLEAHGADDVADRARSALRDADDDHAGALAASQREGLLRVAARDLLGLADMPAAARELAALAEGTIAAACDHTAAEARLAVIGMGKLGGAELNYVSDIDVLFVTDGDLEPATHAAEQLLGLLGTVTPHGRAYEVDASLRPEGRDGPLVRTLDSYASYYARWAEQWELQALLKARPVAGDADVGRRFMDLIEPHVWPDRLDGDRVAEIQATKARVESHRDVRRYGARQVKLAPGGLRDIEFAVQLLQLVHGRHDHALRSPATLEALQALAEGGYVDEGDAALFGDAYQFLRTVEHRLQLLKLRRTHTVPDDDRTRQRLARALGFADIPAATALEQFDTEYRRVQGYVRRLHEKLFFRPLLDRFAEVSHRDRLTAEDGHLDEQAARERLAALGFADPRGAIAHLNALASGVSRRARLFRTLLPAMLPSLADAPDPDGGLAALRRLSERLESSPSFLRTLADNPPVAELLITVLGASGVVGEWLERQPEVFAELADLDKLERSLGAADYQRVAQGVRQRGGDDPERASPLLRKLKRREAARTAVRDLGGMADVREVAGELSSLAEACLDAAVALAVPEGVRMAVIGMGKLGGRELGYASDLDVLLVHDGANEAAAAAAENLIELLGTITPEGAAFEVDLKLRPEGRDGPLSRTLDSYAGYYERWADSWEIQALTQARYVAGDAELGQSFVGMAEPLVYADPVPPGRLEAVRRMKARIEAQRGREGRQRPRRQRPQPSRRPARHLRHQTNLDEHMPVGQPTDLKLGPGGLSDVEWTVQLLQLREGGRDAALRVAGTVPALDALTDGGYLPAEEAGWLHEGWLLQSRVRNARYLSGARDTGSLPSDRRSLERLARMLDYPSGGGQRFAEDLARARRRVRKVHERHFYAD